MRRVVMRNSLILTFVFMATSYACRGGETDGTNKGQAKQSVIQERKGFVHSKLSNAI